MEIKFNDFFYSDNYLKIELGVKTLLHLLSLVEDEKAMKEFHTFVPKILPSLYSAFTNGETDAHGRD